MIATFEAPGTVRLPGLSAARGARIELLRLMTLRELEDAGPATGGEVLDALARRVCSFDLAAPGYALLHDLRDAGYLRATVDRPPRYAITDPGRREAERLAARCWPDVVRALEGLNVCIGCLAPRPGAD
jgi:DNA-binding PadR family transcriptional regulator